MAKENGGQKGEDKLNTFHLPVGGVKIRALRLTMQTQSNSSGKLATATRITATTTKNPHTKVSPMVRYRQKPPITQRSQRSKLQLNDTIANTQRNNSRRRSSMFDDGGREREREA